MKYLHTRITEVTCPARDHALLRFAADGGEDIPGSPGEFFMIRGDWGLHPVLPRAFSLVESGSTGAVLVKAVGEGSERLAAMRPGDRLVVFGPLGHGYEIKPAGHSILVAGGVGVAPLLFLARQLSGANARRLFLYGARTRDDLPLADEIAEVSDLTITTEDGSVGEQGLVTAPLERWLADYRSSGTKRGDQSADSEPVIYTCGPDPMLEAVAKVAAGFGVSCQVALEAPMACGLGTCKGCAVMSADGSYRYVCHDGPVFEASTIFGGNP